MFDDSPPRPREGMPAGAVSGTAIHARLPHSAPAEPDPVDEIQADYLAEAFPGWRIWRTRDQHGRPAGWAASRTADDGIEPTLHASSSGELERLLESPGRRFGRPLVGGDQ
ncbi:hypothetical protein [Nocardiopsis coralliicola]